MKTRPIPITARIAALSMLLALLSNLALLGFVHLRTHSDEYSALRRSAVEQSDVLEDVYRSGGRRGLGEALDDSLSDDPEMVAALVDAKGKAQGGNFSMPASERMRPGFQLMHVQAAGKGPVVEAGVVARRLNDGAWLISGKLVGERLALQRTLERSLMLAVVLAVALGLLCGLLIARYVGLRVRALSAVIDDVGEGDFTRRAEMRGDGDAFDTLSGRINLMLERITALMDELRLLTDSLAHDLRSPVSRLRARVERALITEDDTQRDLMLAGVLDEADALTRMLTTVLEIGRSEAMTARKRFSWVDPIELMIELAEMYEPLADEAGVALTLDRRGVALPLLGHRQLLAQAVSNLIDNALNHGASGGEIALAVTETGDVLRLAVADRGPGIAPNDEAEARRRFGRLDSARSAPGAGLGLALVDAVAHLHGGKLELSDGGPGLCATLVLPCRRIVPSRAAAV